MMKLRLTIFTIILISHLSMAQNNNSIDPNYYSPPLKIPIFLSGNFAELRTNHFHGGIDMKTQGRTGLSVFAAAGGYISRIVISPNGYGNALYIDHPNGSTTVYGHLSKFSPNIEEYIRKIQYQKEEFAMDQTLPVGLLKVLKGEEIAKSGNSGSSGGPHLHFEIRNTKEETQLNPLLYNMPVKDKTKPVIQAIFVYPISEEASVSGQQITQRYEIVKIGNKYQLKDIKTISVYGKIGFGIQSVDLLDGSPNKCGIYWLKLLVDNKLIYSFTLDELAIVDSRYVNSQMDYSRAVRLNQRFYKTWLEPGNKLNIYNTVENRGIIDASDNNLHQVKYEIADAYGNTTDFSFAVQSKETKITPITSKSELFRYDRDNEIENDELEFSIPEGALYDDVDFKYQEKPTLPKFYSKIYQLHNTTVPLHFSCPLKIKADKLPPSLRDKAMLVQIDANSGKIYSATGKYDDGWVKGNIRVLGNYTIAVDTEAPKIISLSITDKKSPKDATDLKFKITDNLSGIEKFRGTIDEKWVLFEYDLKNNLLSYTFDKDRFQFGKNHEVNLVVTDNKGNSNSYKAKFYK